MRISWPKHLGLLKYIYIYNEVITKYNVVLGLIIK